jgi:hypothetical protein
MLFVFLASLTAFAMEKRRTLYAPGTGSPFTKHKRSIVSFFDRCKQKINEIEVNSILNPLSLALETQLNDVKYTLNNHVENVILVHYEEYAAVSQEDYNYLVTFADELHNIILDCLQYLRESHVRVAIPQAQNAKHNSLEYRGLGSH